MLNLIARLTLAALSRRIPNWTAYVGQPWDTADVCPWNLYNLLWRAQHWAIIRMG